MVDLQTSFEAPSVHSNCGRILLREVNPEAEQQNGGAKCCPALLKRKTSLFGSTEYRTYTKVDRSGLELVQPWRPGLRPGWRPIKAHVGFEGLGKASGKACTNLGK